MDAPGPREGHAAAGQPEGLSMRLAALALATCLALPAQAEMSPEERAAFRAEVRAYLLENPEVLVEAMDALQSREDAAAAERDLELLAQNAAAIFDSPDDWVGGNPEGDVVLVEFMDYRCGYCRKAYTDVEELVRTDGNIRFVVKEFPILGEASLMSSQFAIAVRQLHGDDAYKAAHDALIALRGEPTAETLGRLATELGHEAQPILDRMAGPEVMAVIQANHALADKLEISGTPTFVLEDMMVRGYVPLEPMRQIIAEVRS
jgi:protein-disulfide isomerase